MFPRLRHLSQQFLAGCARLSAVLPCCCALCGSIGESLLCDICRQQYFTQRNLRCRQCANLLPGGLVSAAASTPPPCGECQRRQPAFDATIVACDYLPPQDQLVLALKFGGRLALAPLFAQLLRDNLLAAQQAQTPANPLPALLSPVPLGPLRLSERGYNQALEIAKPLSRALGIPLVRDLTFRVRETQAQAMLHPEERSKNMRGVFMVSPHAMSRVRGMHVGIVDDVMTTGATLGEMAATLKRFGAARVTNLVFARTLPH